MDLKNYCKSLRTELETVKAKARDLFTIIEKISSNHRQNFGPLNNELQRMIEEIDEGIDQLQRECPTEWTLQRDELDGKLLRLTEQLERARAKLPPEAFIG